MQVLACTAPTGPLEPAPLTSLALGLAACETSLAAFWCGDDDYVVRVEGAAGSAGASTQWYRVDAETAGPALLTPIEQAERAAIARQLLDVIPMGGSRVAFPVGSTGRTVYRVWRSKGGDARTARAAGRTRILGVRAGRSLRRPA